MKSLLVAVRAVLFAGGFVYLWAWVALAVETLDGRIQVRLPEWTAVLGLTVMAGGAALALSCIALFVTVGRGTPAPFDAPRRFVAVGPYRYVRNPMYVGGFLVLAGWALYRQSPSVLFFAVAWLGLLHLFVLGYEEPTLRGKFGVDYERYLETVSRWLPLRRARAAGRLRRTSEVRPAVALLAISLGAIPSTAEVCAEWACATDGTECSNSMRGNPMRSTARWDRELLLIDSRWKCQAATYQRCRPPAAPTAARFLGRHVGTALTAESPAGRVRLQPRGSWRR